MHPDGTAYANFASQVKQGRRAGSLRHKVVLQRHLFLGSAVARELPHGDKDEAEECAWTIQRGETLPLNASKERSLALADAHFWGNFTTALKADGIEEFAWKLHCVETYAAQTEQGRRFRSRKKEAPGSCTTFPLWSAWTLQRLEINATQTEQGKETCSCTCEFSGKLRYDPRGGNEECALKMQRVEVCTLEAEQRRECLIYLGTVLQKTAVRFFEWS